MKPKRPTTIAIIKHLLETPIGRKRLAKTFELGQQTANNSVAKMFEKGSISLRGYQPVAPKEKS